MNTGDMERKYLLVLAILLGAIAFRVFLDRERPEDHVVKEETSRAPAFETRSQTGAEAGPVLELAVSVQAPYVCAADEGKPGFLIEIINEIFARENTRIRTRVYPWGRGLVELRQNRVDGIVGVLKRNAPELIYPSAEIGSRDYRFYTGDGRWRYRGLRSLGDRIIGLTYGVSYGILDSYIERYRDDDQKIRLLHGEDVTLRKVKLLGRGRIGTFLEDKTVLDYYRNGTEGNRRAGWENAGDSLVLSGAIPKDNIYVAFAPGNEASPDYARMVSEGMIRLRESGRLEDILAEYGLSDWRENFPGSAVARTGGSGPIAPRTGERADTVIHFAGSTAKNSSGYWKYAQKFKEILEASSGGRLRVGLHFGEKSEHDIVMDLAEDQIEMGMIATNNLTPFAPSLEVLTFPYLFPTIDSMEKLLRSPYMRELEETSTQESGVRAISWYIGGFRYLANNMGPIRSTKDLQGMKIRVPRNQVMVETFRAWNLETYPLAWPDVFPSLESGLIHGMENPLNIIFSGLNNVKPIWESLPYISTIHYFVFTAPHLVSEAYFQSLKETDRALIRDAAMEAQAHIWEYVRQEERELVDFAKRKGMSFNEPEDEEADWRSKAISIWPRFYHQVGGKKVIDKIQEIIQR